MVIEVFNGNIAVPAKCGTRYFNKCVKSSERPVDYMEKIFTGLPLNCDVPMPNGTWFPIEQIELWNNIEYLIVRDPFEHLKSAIHTEIVSFWNDLDKVKPFIDEFISDGGNTHWHPQFYKKIYCLHKNHNIPRFKIIQINEITNFLLSMGYDIEYNKEEYSFFNIDNWKSKEECVEIVKDNFPDEWNKILKFISNDMEYYDIIINNKNKLI